MLNFGYAGSDEDQCKNIHRTWACEIISESILKVAVEKKINKIKIICNALLWTCQFVSLTHDYQQHLPAADAGSFFHLTLISAGV